MLCWWHCRKSVGNSKLFSKTASCLWRGNRTPATSSSICSKTSTPIKTAVFRCRAEVSFGAWKYCFAQQDPWAVESTQQWDQRSGLQVSSLARLSRGERYTSLCEGFNSCRVTWATKSWHHPVYVFNRWSTATYTEIQQDVVVQFKLGWCFFIHSS